MEIQKQYAYGIGKIVNIKILQEESFAPYGVIILDDNKDGKRFDVKLADELASGWRIAVLKFQDRSINQLHCHPTSMEVFELVRGVVVLIVATANRPDCLQAFLLDKTVCVNKGIWHGTISLSEEAVVRITENAMMSKETLDTQRTLSVSVV